MNLVLDYKGFEPYLIRKIENDGKTGVQYIFRFENNYGASVVKNRMSDGHQYDFWELAVIGFYDESNEKWDLIYTTSVTPDVEGYLIDWEVRNLLKKIKEL